jgi:co-chaperonin GroES (HSP10)
MIVPLIHRILIKQDRLEETDETFRSARASGIVIPDLDERVREQAAVDTGVVVRVGETAFRDFGTTSPIEVGDSVVYAKYAGKTIVDPVTKEKFVAINDEDVIAKLIKEPQDG